MGLAQAQGEGATVLTGGERQGSMCSPTVLTDTTHQMKVVREEAFGPVCSVMEASSFEDALAMDATTAVRLYGGDTTIVPLACSYDEQCDTNNCNCFTVQEGDSITAATDAGNITAVFAQGAETIPSIRPRSVSNQFVTSAWPRSGPIRIAPGAIIAVKKYAQFSQFE